MSVLRLAVGLTIWFTFVEVILLSVGEHVPTAFDLPVTFVILSFYVLMPVRWACVLTLMIRRVRLRPLRWLPRALPVQAVFVTVVQLVLGLLSLLGFLEILINTNKGEQRMGIVLHLVLPAFVVYALARSAGRTPSTLSP